MNNTRGSNKVWVSELFLTKIHFSKRF